MKITADTVWTDILKIRNENPLIHNITNYVVMNNTANALLAMGASPVMAHAENEVNEMVAIAKALVINIGTLSDPWISSMKKALLAAKNKKIPVVLDPVGAGATTYRTNTVNELLTIHSPTIIRGNASEIKSVANYKGLTKGVDSQESSKSAIDAALNINSNYQCVISVSGEIDYIIDGNQTVGIANGHPMMPQITGLGCTASALTGAFIAVNSSPFQAAAHAMIVMGVAGELAGIESKGPGSFQVAFLDALYNLTKEQICEKIKIVE